MSHEGSSACGFATDLSFTVACLGSGLEAVRDYPSSGDFPDPHLTQGSPSELKSSGAICEEERDLIYARFVTMIRAMSEIPEIVTALDDCWTRLLDFLSLKRTNATLKW